MEDNDNEKAKRCTQCRRELGYGEEVIILQEAVVGPRGLVPLNEPVLFCSEDCLSDFVSKGDVTTMPRRIP